LNGRKVRFGETRALPEGVRSDKFTIARAQSPTREARLLPGRSAAIPLTKCLVATVVGVEQCRA